MIAGGKPTDGGNLVLSPEEMRGLLSKHPALSLWIKPFSMGAEFINGKERYCLWFPGISPKELRELPLEVKERIAAVKAMRLSSTKEATQKKAETPWLFDEVRPPEGESYIAIPKVSSERRQYIPMGFVSNGMIPGDKLFYISDAGLYEFGVISSLFHNAWMRVVGGRLKSDYSYSNTIVYNNFVWPDLPAESKPMIESCAQSVLDARSNYHDSSLADLYDPDFMPPDLLKAHKALDKAVEQAYGVNFNGDEEKIVAHLFKLYAAATRKDGH